LKGNEEEENRKRDGSIRFENDMRAVSVCKGIWKIETSEDLGQSWPTLNSWEKGEGEEEVEVSY